MGEAQRIEMSKTYGVDFIRSPRRIYELDESDPQTALVLRIVDIVKAMKQEEKILKEARKANADSGDTDR
jgi:hypothetical protein